jgi:hypothetical protein
MSFQENHLLYPRSAAYIPRQEQGQQWFLEHKRRRILSFDDQITWSLPQSQASKSMKMYHEIPVYDHVVNIYDSHVEGEENLAEEQQSIISTKGRCSSSEESCISTKAPDKKNTFESGLQLLTKMRSS